MWYYKGEVISSIEDFPPQTFGFVYRVIHQPTGKIYIGKKVLQFVRKTKLTKKDLSLYEGTKGRKPSYKQVVKESDWQTYWGSNKILTNLLKNEPIENFKREMYSGCIGFFTPEDDFDFNVVIRSLFYNATTNALSYAVGGAIINASTPEEEYEETILKAKAIQSLFN